MTNRGGKNTKTTAELKADGTFRKDRHADRVAVKILAEVPPAPKHFDAAHKEQWKVTCTRLLSDSLITAQDLGAVEIVVKLEVATAKIHTKLMAEEYVINTTTTTKPNPLALLYLQYNAQLMAVYAQFGQTPRARMSLKVEKKGEGGDPFAGLLNDN